MTGVMLLRSELTEINDDRAYMEDLVWSIVKELTE